MPNHAGTCSPKSKKSEFARITADGKHYHLNARKDSNRPINGFRGCPQKKEIEFSSYIESLNLSLRKDRNKFEIGSFNLESSRRIRGVRNWIGFRIESRSGDPAGPVRRADVKDV